MKFWAVINHIYSVDILNAYSQSSWGFSLPPLMLWGRQSPNRTISHIRKRSWNGATSEYRKHNHFWPRFSKTYFPLLLITKVTLMFGKCCRRGITCDKLWHDLLHDLWHILSIWEKTGQHHICVSQALVTSPGQSQPELGWTDCRNSSRTEEAEEACHVLLWLAIYFPASLSICEVVVGKK